MPDLRPLLSLVRPYLAERDLVVVFGEQGKRAPSPAMYASAGRVAGERTDLLVRSQLLRGIRGSLPGSAVREILKSKEVTRADLSVDRLTSPPTPKMHALRLDKAVVSLPDDAHEKVSALIADAGKYGTLTITWTRDRMVVAATATSGKTKRVTLPLEVLSGDVPEHTMRVGRPLLHVLRVPIVRIFRSNDGRTFLRSIEESLDLDAEIVRTCASADPAESVREADRRRAAPSPVPAAPAPSERTIDPRPSIMLSLAAYLSQTAKDKGYLSPTIATQEASAMVDSWGLPEAITWERTQRCTLRDAREAKRQRTAHIIACRIESVTTQRLTMITTQDKQTVEMDVARASLMEAVGARGEKIDTLPIVGAARIRQIEQHLGESVQILAIPVSVPEFVDPKEPHRIHTAQNRETVIHALEVRPIKTAFDQIAATETERAAANRLLADLARTKTTPLDYLYRELVTRFGIEIYPEMELLIRAVIVQSVATGHMRSATAKISLLVYGPPGVGKSRLIEMAQDLNPSFSVLGSRITAAGITGATVQKRGGYAVEPGPLQLAYDGVVGAPDAHKWTDADLKRSKIDGVLQSVMQDGYFAVSTSGAPGEKIYVQTGFIIDMNPPKKSGEGALVREDAIVSRLDSLVTIPPDDVRAARVLSAINRRLDDDVGAPGGVSREESARPLKVLVATLRDRYARITRSDDVIAQMDELRVRSTEAVLGNMRLTTEHSARLSVNMQRWVIAHARACARDTVQAEDLVFGLTMIRHKLEWIREHAGTGAAPGTGHETLMAYIRSHASAEGGLSAPQVARAYEAEHGVRYSDETVARAFKGLRGEWAYSVQRKRWLPVTR